MISGLKWVVLILFALSAILNCYDSVSTFCSVQVQSGAHMDRGLPLFTCMFLSLWELLQDIFGFINKFEIVRFRVSSMLT